jgi:hypothetical protein
MRLIFLHGPATVVAQRVEAPARQASGKLSSLALPRELEGAGAFDYPQVPTAAVTVDSSVLDPADAARQVVAALGLG